jgi:hypothetical protein
VHFSIILFAEVEAAKYKIKRVLLQKKLHNKKAHKKAVTGFPWVQTDSKKLHNRKAHKKGSDRFPTGFLANTNTNESLHMC